MRFLFVDRILQLSSSAGSARGIKRITQDDIYVTADTEGQFCFMPSIIGETLGQLTAWEVMANCDFQKRPVAGVVERATLHHSAYVGDTLALESWIDRQDDESVRYHGHVHVGDTLIFSLEGALGPMLPMDEFIDSALVRRQFAEINRPGDWPLPQTVVQTPLPTTNRPVSLCFDAITLDEPGVRMDAVKQITRASPYFPDHFPYKPVLPLTVLLECKMQLAQTFLARAGLSTYRIRALQRIKMNDFVQPGDEVHTQVSVKSQTEEAMVLHFRSEVAGKRVCVLDIVLDA